MKVLKGKVLVVIKTMTSDSLVAETKIRKGIVSISGSDQVEEYQEILFGDHYEEIEIDRMPATRYYLMDESNIKIIFSGDDPEKKANVLPFVTREILSV